MDEAKKNYRLIKEAYSALNKMKFQEAIAILESVLSSGAGDVYVLLLLCVAYLHTDQFGKLARFITKIKEKNPGYLPLVQLEAYLKLKSIANYEDALKLYIDLASKYPGDTHIHRGRNLLLNNTSAFEEFQKNARLQDFMYIPRPPRPVKSSSRRPARADLPEIRHARSSKGPRLPAKWVLRILIGVFFLAAGAITGWYAVDTGFFSSAVVRMKKSGRDFSSIDMISVTGTDYDLIKKNIKRDRVPVYYESGLEMAGEFNRARKLIKAEKYNEAAIILNRLYSSNVNFVVKEKVDFLIKFVINAEDREFAELPFRSVSEKKYLYRGYAIRWNGTVARVKEKDDSLVFTIRMGGSSGDGSGEADVYSRKIVPGLRKGSPVELEGVIVDFIGKDKTLYIVSRRTRVFPPAGNK